MNLAPRKLGKTEKKTLKEFISKNYYRLMEKDFRGNFHLMLDLAEFNGINPFHYVKTIR